MNPKTAVLRVGAMKLAHSRFAKGTPDVKIEGHSGRRELRQVAAEQAREIHKQRQQRQGYDACDYSGDHKKLEGVDREGLDSVDLFSHPHIGEHGANPRADTSGQQETCYQRTDLDKKSQRL